MKTIYSQHISQYTIWLFNIAMENPPNKWRFRSLGKSSISMGHLYHGYVTNHQRVTMVYGRYNYNGPYKPYNYNGNMVYKSH